MRLYHNLPKHWPLLLLAVLTVITRLGYLVEPPNLDQGVELVLAKEIVSGQKLYSEIWDHRGPLLYYLYALGLYLSGGNLWCFHVLEILNTVVAGFLVYYLLLRIFHKTAALLAFFTYALVFNQVLFGGWYSRAQTEVFYEIPVLLLFILGHRVKEQDEQGRPGHWPAFLQGLLWALLLFLKLSVAPIVLCVLADYWTNARERRWQKMCIRLGYFTLGSLLFTALVFVWFIFQGSLRAFWEAYFVYNYHCRFTVPWTVFLERLPGFFYVAPLAIIAAYGYMRYCFLPQKRLALLLWPFLALMQIVFQNNYCWYQFIPCLTPLVVMSSIGITMFLQRLNWGASRTALAGLIIVVVLLLPFFVVCYSYYQDHGIVAYCLGEMTQEEFLSLYSWPDHSLNLLATWQAAQYLKSSAQPEDRLSVLGFNGDLYLYSALRPGTSYVFFHLIPHPLYQRQILQEIWQELAAKRPKFIAVIKDVDALYGIYRSSPSYSVLIRFSDLLKSNYRHVRNFHEVIDIYQRN